MNRSTLRLLPILFLLVLLATNCENFLTQKPKGIISPDNYYKNDKQAITAVSGLYELFQRNYYTGMFSGTGILKYYKYGADILYSPRVSSHWGPIQNYTITPGYDEMERTWRNIYQLIKNVNLTISKVKDNELLSKKVREEALGQALFIRAYFYYHLTNLWGDVPYYRTNLSITKASKLSRTNKTKIRKDLVNDLKKAEKLLPNSYPTDQKGRADKWAAKTLLAHIDLWLKDWKGAHNASVDIINNSPYKLLEDYANIFKETNEYNEEIIWQIPGNIDINVTTPTDEYNPRLQDEPKNLSKKQTLQDSLSAHGLAMDGYGQASPLPSLVKEWPNDDLRKESSIACSLFGIKFNRCYFSNLWNLDTINSPRDNHGDNIILFRLADVYLMAAEAENEINGPANAYQFVNRIRERAFNPDQPLSGLTQVEFREAIYNERKWELAGQGYRRLDLIRWGILEQKFKNASHPTYPNAASHYRAYKQLLPIPALEISRNPNLAQNPGYGGAE